MVNAHSSSETAAEMVIAVPPAVVPVAGVIDHTEGDADLQFLRWRAVVAAPSAKVEVVPMATRRSRSGVTTRYVRPSPGE